MKEKVENNMDKPENLKFQEEYDDIPDYKPEEEMILNEEPRFIQREEEEKYHTSKKVNEQEKQ